MLQRLTIPFDLKLPTLNLNLKVLNALLTLNNADQSKQLQNNP